MKVLYISGAERSGTTVAGNVLATLPRTQHVGELDYLGNYNDVAGHVCGCGSPVDECLFWRAVLLESRVSPTRWQTLRKSTSRVRHIPAHLHALKRHGVVYEYARMASDIYRAVGAQGNETVIDSSKRAGGAFAAWVAPEVETYILHVVRDPRAVAFSRAKRPKNHGVNGNGQRMAQRPVAVTSRGWLMCNTEIELVRRLGIPSSRFRRVRYEDLMADPRNQFQEIAEWLGRDGAKLAFEDSRKVTLSRTHTVKGNPNRFSTGAIELVPDEQWRHGLSEGEKRACSAVCSSLMLRYGYPLRG